MRPTIGYDTRMRPWLIFLVVISCATWATAQSSIDPNEFAGKKDLHNAELNQLWRTLGISAKIRVTTAEGSEETSESFSCGSDAAQCEVAFLDGGGDGPDSVVRITAPLRNLRRFLVFDRDDLGGAWRLADYLDSTEWDYDEPDVSAVFTGGKRWLVLKAWPHCGTGCSLIHTDWFELKNGKLRMVLTVPLSGHNLNANPARAFETRLVRASQSEGRETLEFIYQVDFDSGFGSSIDVDYLWDDEKAIRFSRPKGQGEFKFDAKNSEASEGFVKEIFTSNEVGQPRLFELVQDHLLEIARGPQNRRREWLKDLLEKNPDLPQLARVRDAFNNAR
jgi:hypothetical protein